MVMTRRLMRILSIALICVLFLSAKVVAFDDRDTHPRITQKAASASKLQENFGDVVSGMSLCEMIELGEHKYDTWDTTSPYASQRRHIRCVAAWSRRKNI